jgi:hypothetical protein
VSTLLSTSEGEAGGHAGMAGSNVLVNILKPVNIVNLGNTLRCGVGKSGLEVLSRHQDY